jgi:CheY-like chemotaxis protein
MLMLEGILDKYNLILDKAYDGESAYQKILQDQLRKAKGCQGYKLVILDNEMPLMSGIEVAIKLRQG